MDDILRSTPTSVFTFGDTPEGFLFWRNLVNGPNGLNCQLVDVEAKPRVFSQETKEKMSRAKKGKKLSKKHIESMIKSRIGRGKKVINLETGEIFNTVKKAAESIDMKHTTLVMMLKGHNKNKTKMNYYEHG